jgi:tRNA threonylcarbamoyladenosine biosynthesis protein TsaE
MLKRLMTLTYNLSQIDSIAKEVLAFADQRIILFKGTMGVGKTTLIKAICRHLGVEEETVSPTFSIVNEYQGAQQQKIYHFDLYRLNKAEELLDLGFEDYLQQADWMLIEWPEKMENYGPECFTQLDLKLANRSNRELIATNKC